MFKTVILAQDAALAKAAQSWAMDSGYSRVLKAIPSYPANPYEVARLLSQHDPELVLLHATEPEQALGLGVAIRSRATNVSVIVMGGPFSEEMEEEFRKAGVEPLTGTFTPEKFAASIRNAIYYARADLMRNLFLFLPAKAGNGASTVALNIAAAMANGLEKRVLLAEGDLHSGILSTMLNVQPKAPLVDVLRNAESLDFSVWENIVVRAHSIDLLPTDRSKKLPLPTWVNYHQLLRFAAPRYDNVLVDLPEVVNDATADLVHYAKTVFVVCTPEFPSLTLAGQRLKELESKGLPRDRAEIVLNRWHKGDITVAQVEELVKARVAVVIQNDYRAVNSATVAGRPVKPQSELGLAFLNFAKKMLGIPVPPPPPQPSGFGLLRALRTGTPALR